MKPIVETPKNTTKEDLEAQVHILQERLAETEAKLNWYEEQFRLNQHRRFGVSSERTHTEQQSLFNEAEAHSGLFAAEPDLESITYQRRKKTGKRKDDLKELPVEVIEYRLDEQDQVCSCCGGSLHVMSKETSRELHIIPAQAKVVEHVRYVYSCRHCERNEETTPIITAPKPSPVIPKSIASPSAVAYIMQQKYADGMPLYRQEQQFSRFGLELSRQTMANWIIFTATKWLTPLYERMKDYLLAQDIIQADETTLQVLKEPGRNPQSQSYMWLYRTGWMGPPIVLFDYQYTRAGIHPKRFLENFKGYLQTDGYAGYNQVESVTHIGCWAHARRKFDEALKALGNSQIREKSRAKQGLDFCNQLFAIEKRLKDSTPEKRYEERLKSSRPVLEAFLAWLHGTKPDSLPKSSLGQAVTYCLSQWSALEGFLQDGRLDIDNNRSERSIKPFVIGRKNFLFSNTPAGATASATVYSVIETAKENKLNPFTYLTYLFEQLPNTDLSDKDNMDRLLPWADSLPDNCKLRK